MNIMQKKSNKLKLKILEKTLIILVICLCLRKLIFDVGSVFLITGLIGAAVTIHKNIENQKLE